MTDAIDRLKAIDAIDGALLDGISEGIAIDILLDLPSAQPEIIRCRDCKHWDKTWTNDWSPDYHYCPMIDGVRKGDFYCADAERRPDE